MRKAFVEFEAEVIKFGTEDIITTSNDNPNVDENENGDLSGGVVEGDGMGDLS